MNGSERSRPEREAVIIGYGFEYLVMAVNCARSIRTSNPGLATALVTNVPVDPAALADVFDRVVVRDEPTDQNRLVKTSILDHTVGERVLYVDADSEVVGDLDPFFRLVNRFDVVLRLQAVPVNKAFELAEGIPGGAFPHLHGGAFLVRDAQSGRDFLAHWQRRMLESGLSRDQPALARTVFDLPDLRLLTVNAVLCADDFEAGALFKPKHEQPRIWHYGEPAAHPAVAARLARVVNASDEFIIGSPRGEESHDAMMGLRNRYRWLSHPLARNRWSRTAFLWAVRRISRRRQSVDPMRREQRVKGEIYVSGARGLWSESDDA